jgi:hypothetical protein
VEKENETKEDIIQWMMGRVRGMVLNSLNFINLSHYSLMPRRSYHLIKPWLQDAPEAWMFHPLEVWIWKNK